MNMISDDQLKALRKQEGRLEVIKSIMNSIHDVWQNVKKELVSADVNTGLKMWYDTLVRIISKSEELASKEAGKTSIFGATAYKHFDKLQQRLDKMANTLSGEFNGALRAINAGFDGVLTIIEESIFGILNMIDKLYEMRGILVSISKIGTGALIAKGAASLLGLSGPIGWITAGVLALDQAIKHIAGMDKSVLAHIFTTLAEEAGKALIATEKFFRGYIDITGKLTTEGIANLSKIVDVKTGIRDTKNELALLKDEVNAIAAASWLPDVMRDIITKGKLGHIEELEEKLELLRKRLYELQNPIDKTAEGLRTFVLEAKELNKVMKELNFDPLREFESTVKSGNVGMAKRIAEIIKAETMADIAAVQERIAVFQKDLAKDPNNKNVSTAVTALEVELGKLEARYERVSNAANLANEALIAQVDPLTALWEENTRLGKALEGKTQEYEKELKIQQTIDALREKMGKRYHEGIAQQVRDVVEMIYHKKEELALMKDKDDATKKTTENIKDQVRIVQARLAAMREERKLALDNWKESNKFRQEGLDREREAYDEMRQVFYEYYTTETEREYNEFLKRASHFEAYIEGNKELTDEFYKWRADMAERYEKPWLAGLKDGLKKASDNIGWTFENVSDTVQAAFSNMTDTLTDFVMTGKASFSDFADSIIRDMLRMQIQASITQPLASGLGDLFGSFGQSMANAWYGNVSAVGAAGPMPQANGGVFQSPSLHAYANTVQTSPKLFTFAQGGVFAEAGPEAVMPLTRDANGRLGVQAEGSETKIELNIINESGQPVEAKERSRRTDMGKTIMDIVLTRVSNNTGGAKNAFKAALSG
jgi:lambda family phage tail tape measure protein